MSCSREGLLGAAGYPAPRSSVPALLGLKSEDFVWEKILAFSHMHIYVHTVSGVDKFPVPS